MICKIYCHILCSMRSSYLRILCTDNPVLQNYFMHDAIEPVYSAPGLPKFILPHGVTRLQHYRLNIYVDYDDYDYSDSNVLQFLLYFDTPIFSILIRVFTRDSTSLYFIIKRPLTDTGWGKMVPNLQTPFQINFHDIKPFIWNERSLKYVSNNLNYNTLALI